MLNYIKKNYKVLNIVFLLLSIYVILFPIIIMPIQFIFPEFAKCPYLELTGNPCPLCGGTRYIQNLPHNIFSDITYLFHPFGIMILFVIFEILFRIYILFKHKNSKKLIHIDLIIHTLAIMLFFGYEIIFLINN